MKKFRKQSGGDGGQRGKPAGGIQLCRHGGAVPASSITVAAAQLPKGRYRRVTGNEAAALGLVAAAHRAGRHAGLRQLSDHAGQRDPARTVRSTRNSTCARCRPRTRSPPAWRPSAPRSAGRSGPPGPAGPGLSLKAEGLGLAVMTELPLVVINVQRAGPSTGMPTKTEQADLLMAMYGRHGECPLPVLAAATPADCFCMAFEAVRLAIKYMTPVLLLSDSFLANGAEPWRVVDPDDLPDLQRRRAARRRGASPPIAAIRETLARPWVRPGTPGCEHRIGGLEKEDVTGAVSYDAANHHRMVALRAEKIAGIAGDIPPAEVVGTRGRRPAGGRLGQHLRRDCRRRRRSCSRRARRWPICTCAT